jgi:hypothetical protein
MKTKGWTKLFSDILTSSVWTEPSHVRLVWITILALCDADGLVRASVPGLASVARVEIGECENALRIFENPDKYSRSTDFDGRRLERMEGGWRVLNFKRFRDEMSAEQQKDYWRLKQRQHRERAKISGKMARLTR